MYGSTLNILRIFNYSGSFDDPHHKAFSHGGWDQLPCVWASNEWYTVRKPRGSDLGRKLHSPGRGRLSDGPGWKTLDCRGQVKLDLCRSYSVSGMSENMLLRPATHTDFISIYRFFTLRIWQNTDFLPQNLSKY